MLAKLGNLLSTSRASDDKGTRCPAAVLALAAGKLQPSSLICDHFIEATSPRRCPVQSIIL